MHKALHPRDEGNRLYVSGIERGVTSVKDSVDASRHVDAHEDYWEERGGRLIQPPESILTEQGSIERMKTKMGIKTTVSNFNWLTSDI